MICIHPEYEVARTYDQIGCMSTDVATCSVCEATLYVRKHKALAGPGMDATEYYDEIYELLYTNKGRTRLAAAYLLSIGIEIPECWNINSRDVLPPELTMKEKKVSHDD